MLLTALLLLVACDAPPPPAGVSCDAVVAGDQQVSLDEHAEDLCAAGGTVRGDLEVQVADWTDLAPLGCVCAVRGTLALGGMPELTSLGGLERLQAVGGLRVASVAALPDFSGFALRTIPGALELGSGAPLTLDGLEGVEELGAFSAYGARLEDTAGLAGLRTLGSMSLVQVESLRVLTGPDGVATLDTLWLRNDDALEAIVGFDALGAVLGDVDLSYDPALVALDGLAGVATIGGHLQVIDSDALAALDGLGSLTTVGGDLVLEDDALLADLDGLAALQDVGGNLTIRNNPALPAWQVETLLQRVRVRGTVTVYNNGG